MQLPNHVTQCIDALESAGFQAYAVGGCVRDSLLGLVPHDYDLCTDALPEEIQAVFPDRKQILTGARHGTVTIVTDDGPVEITTFRTEGPYSDSRRPDWVEFVKDIRLDLQRRDFTVNAIAYSPVRGFVDPFGGRADLDAKQLRTVGEANARFREDPLRILRGMRFSSRFQLDPTQETYEAMCDQASLIQELAIERVFEELSAALPTVSTQDLLFYSPVLSCCIPELAPMVDFDQCSPHHAYDLYTHTASVCGSVPGDLTLRWAALLHDIGKVPTFRRDETGRGHFKRHAPVGAEMADAALRRMKAPNALREEAVWLIANHMTEIPEDRPGLQRMLTRYDKHTLLRLIDLQKADMSSKGMGEDDRHEHFQAAREMLNTLEPFHLQDLAVDGNDLIARGCSGQEIGITLNNLFELVLSGEVPNTKEALLSFVK